MALTKVTKSGITNDAIDGAKLENTSITSADIAPGTLTNAKLENSSVTVNGTSVSLGGSVDTTYISWQSVITADGSTTTTAVAGNGYFIDTTSAAHTINLPASPSAGDTVAIKDYAGTFGTNALTIGRNSENIQGAANNSELSTNRASVILVYVDATKGWLYSNESNVGDLQQSLFTEATGGTETTSGDFKIHTFTGDGCLAVSQLGNGATVPTGGPANVDYLVVAGGGGSCRGCSGFTSGGGGAGGYRTSFPSPDCNAGAFPVSVTTYPITVGGGGAGGSNGSNSVFSTITSAGGGKSGGIYADNGSAGGSGGGGQSNGFDCGPFGFSGSGGAGNTPPVSPPQGNPGGAGDGNQPTRLAGGGGGAGGAGSTGPGGAGSSNSITGSSVTYAGGGGGGAQVSPAGSGGSGGGGNGGYGGTGSPQPLSPSTAGAANTGGGGGGYFSYPSQGSPASLVGGGKGIVIIRYKYQ